MRVVDQDLHAVQVEHVQPPGRLVDRGRERPQPLTDVVQVGARRVRGRGGGHRVLHHHPGPTVEGRRQRVHPRDRHRATSLADHHPLAERALLEHDGLAAAPHPPVDQRVLRIHREQDHAAAARPSHLEHERVVGVEDRPSVLRHRLDHDLLDGRELLERVDALEAEVIARHVQDDGDVVAPVAESLPQDPPASGLEDREVDPRVLQHHLRGLGPLASARLTSRSSM